MNVYVCNKCRELEEALFGVDEDMVITNDELPNLTLKEMMGEGDSKKINMLCQECNAGVVSEFKKSLDDVKPDGEELAIASFSKYNFVTQYDHPESCLTPDKSKRFGFKLNPPAIGIYNQMVMYAIDNNVKNIKMTDHPLYDEWVAEGDDFDIEKIKNFTGDIGKHIRETKLNGRKDLKSNPDQQLAKVLEMQEKDKHWKETQSEEERESMLKKAQLKREIKELKKSLSTTENKEEVLAKIEAKREELKNA